jgi:hypothetical protein
LSVLKLAQTLGTEGFDITENLNTLVEHNVKAPGLVELFSTLAGESLSYNHTGHDFFVKRYQSLR